MISIASLIYKSPKWADFVYASLVEHTPKLLNGEAEFFFVANDATENVKSHLISRGYKFFENNNKFLSSEQLFEKGYAGPEYIHRVYRGWNAAINCASGDVVVLINSDMAFSDNWLENLLKNLKMDTYVVSQLAEPARGRKGLFPGAFYCPCGVDIESFNKIKFEQVSEIYGNRFKNVIRAGGAYMPMAIHKSNLLKVGLFPEGNLAGRSFSDVLWYGDQYLTEKLSKIGVKHITAMDSLVYHFKEGEFDSND